MINGGASMLIVFFFQAEDGIRDLTVTGVQTCALPICLHNDINLPYFLAYTNEEQKRRWLPGMCSGELITAIAMTEPDTGSDLAAVRTTALRRGDFYLLNGQKTFITNGILGFFQAEVGIRDLTVTGVQTCALPI